MSADPLGDSSVSSPSGAASPSLMPTAIPMPLPGMAAVPSPVELLTREEGALRRVIQRYVRDGSTVDDLFQEVSLKVLRRMDTVRDPAALRGLAVSACSQCLSRLSPPRRSSPTGPRRAPGRSSRPRRYRPQSWRTFPDSGTSDGGAAGIGTSAREPTRSDPLAGRGRPRPRCHRHPPGHQPPSGGSPALCRGRAALKEQLENILGGEL